MMKSKKNFISFSDSDEIIAVQETDPRVVTPENPLVINYSPAEFTEIDIQGGQIYTQVETTVTIRQLTKTS